MRNGLLNREILPECIVAKDCVSYIISGLSLILLGLIVVVIPELIVAMVAGGLVLAGLTLIVFSFKARKARNYLKKIAEQAAA
jgi:Flp pilus assembly protein TadB